MPSITFLDGSSKPVVVKCHPRKVRGPNLRSSGHFGGKWELAVSRLNTIRDRGSVQLQTSRMWLEVSQLPVWWALVAMLHVPSTSLVSQGRHRKTHN